MIDTFDELRAVVGVFMIVASLCVFGFGLWAADISSRIEQHEQEHKP